MLKPQTSTIMPFMEKDRLFSNRDRAARDMKAQTGKEPGGPTGMCGLFVAGALTGSEMRYVANLRPVAQEDELFSAGLLRHEVDHTIPDRLAVLSSTLRPVPGFAVDAAIIQGEMKDGYGHMMAVVPTETSTDEGQTEKEFHVVNSLAKNGIVSFTTSEDAVGYIDSQFKKDTIRISVKPTEEEIQRRMQPEDHELVMERIIFDEGVYVETQIPGNDPRFFGTQEIQPSTEDTIQDDKEAFRKVMHAIVDDLHGEYPVEKLHLYNQFATVAAGYDMRYPLLSEIAMDHLSPGEVPSKEDLANLHTTIETTPVEDGTFATQVTASTLRKAKRLVTHYDNAQQADSSLPTVSTEQTLSFLDEQIAHYKEMLVASGDVDQFVPRSYTDDELLKSTREVYESAREAGLDVMTPTHETEHDDGSLSLSFGYTKDLGRRHRWYGERLTSWSLALSLRIPKGQTRPVVYGLHDGSSKEIMIDGRGSVHGVDVESGINCTVHTSNASSVRVEDRAVVTVTNAHVGSLELYGDSDATIKNSAINAASLRSEQSKIFALYSQIGAVSASKGSFEAVLSDIGTLNAKDVRARVYDSDVVQMDLSGPHTFLNMQQGECDSFKGTDGAKAVNFTEYPQSFILDEGEFFVGREHIHTEPDGRIIVKDVRYIGASKGSADTSMEQQSDKSTDATDEPAVSTSAQESIAQQEDTGDVPTQRTVYRRKSK